jgi:hypothetical protein
MSYFSYHENIDWIPYIWCIPIVGSEVRCLLSWVTI